MSKLTHAPLGRLLCEHCAPESDAINHPLGWQPCAYCDGSGLAVEPEPKAIVEEDQVVVVFRSFLAIYDRNDPADRQIVTRIREQVHRELYRREREHFPELVDIGGET